MTTATQFIAHDGDLIWGVGPTEDAAIKAAHDMSNEIAKLQTCECTPELAQSVEDRGGNIAFGLLPDGRMGTYDQHFDAA